MPVAGERLGDGRGENDLAPLAGQENAVLLLLGQATVQGQHRRARGRGGGGERFLRPPDLPLARQEAEDVAGRLAQGLRDRAAHGHLTEVLRLDRVHAPLRAHHRGAVEMRGHLVRVERRGHHEQPQVVAERAAHFEREREADVARERALVEFVEDDKPRVGELGIGEEALREESLRHDLEARRGGDPALEAHLVADRAAHAFAALPRDVRRAVARREPPRLEHHDLTAVEPGLVQQRRRHAGRLAAARRRRQHNLAVRRERAANFANLLLYRERHFWTICLFRAYSIPNLAPPGKQGPLTWTCGLESRPQAATCADRGEASPPRR